MLPLSQALEFLNVSLLFFEDPLASTSGSLSFIFSFILLQIEILSLSPRKNPSNGKTYGVNLQNGP
jgi:hypothetical protein